MEADIFVKKNDGNLCFFSWSDLWSSITEIDGQNHIVVVGNNHFHGQICGHSSRESL